MNNQLASNLNIYADNNAVGRQIFHYIPELSHFEYIVPGDIAEYVAPNLNRGPIGQQTRQSIADYENVSLENVVIDGSGLNRLKTLSALLGAKEVVTVSGDFPGYNAAKDGLEHIVIPCSIEDKELNKDIVINVVKALKAPIVFLSMPITNPGQTRINLEIADIVQQVNSSAYVIIDAAYRQAVPYAEDYVKYALENPRVLYLNVAAKDLGACGARFSWMIGTSEMLQKVSPDVCPYPVSMYSARYINQLTQRRDVIRNIHYIQKQALHIYSVWAQSQWFEYIDRGAPWILVNFGQECSEIVDRLKYEHNVYVQDQTGKSMKFDGWIRISATVPSEALRVVEALRQVTKNMNYMPPPEQSSLIINPPD